MKQIFIGFFLIINIHSIANQLNDHLWVNNVWCRNHFSLNGEWQIIVDQFNRGLEVSKIWKDEKPEGKNEFIEYAFDGGPTLNVPGDWNSQIPNLEYYEGIIWYKKTFEFKENDGLRKFIYFGAVNYHADVYINNEYVGHHEGGFTPFVFEISDNLREGKNSVIVRVDNKRSSDAIPSLSYDWWNYGGITRDVLIFETPETFIKDYFIQLKKGSLEQVKGWVKIEGTNDVEDVDIKINEIGLHYKCKTNNEGYVEFEFPAHLTLWSPSNPKLYKVKIESQTDSVSENIGFRSIKVSGSKILLNDKPVFLKGINIHEEIAQRKGRAFSKVDAIHLLSEAKELGANFIRLAHYPQNEHMIRTAEEMGFMMWEEIPIWQGIDFENSEIMNKAYNMLSEMIHKDKNRAGIIIWSMSNETVPSKRRNETIINMIDKTRKLDPTRLITSAFDRVKYEGNSITIDDTLSNYLDVLAVNEYLGWYKPWPSDPKDIIWHSDFDKPLIISEFGAEALYGNHESPEYACSWSEEYQANVYKSQIEMFQNISFLGGIAPWLLYDFRSPFRMHPRFQKGWNRKGLISDRGMKKQAWYVLKEFYDSF